YPMNWAWYDGKMSLEHYREEHGLDANSLLEASRTLENATGSEESQAAASASKNGDGPAAPAADAAAEGNREEMAPRP
ncbi:MAG TPA: hypothetical protein VGR48_10955, partial [Terriglobales bacterium]|nr:hypothetical protein [Terriglobales bacterium]